MTSAHFGEAVVPAYVRRDVTRIRRLAGETEQMIGDLLDMVRIVTAPERVGTVDLGAVTAQALDGKAEETGSPCPGEAPRARA